jgi:hypothetical protein
MLRSPSSGKFVSDLPNEVDGAPYLELLEEVTEMRRLRFTWVFIAKELGITYKVIRRWVKRNNFQDPSEYSRISDDELDAKVLEFMEGNPNRGVRSRLEAVNIHIPRSRSRDTILRVDYEGRMQRYN